MITVETYADLPRKLGAHAFVILGLLQAAKMAGETPTTAQWLFDHAPNYGTGSITAALRKLTSPDIQLAVRVTGGWVLNDKGAFQLPLGYSLVDGQKQISQNRSQSDSRIGNAQAQSGQNRSGSDFVDGKVLPAETKNRSESDSYQSNAEKTGQNRSESDFAESLDRLESFNFNDKDLNTEDLKNLDSLDSKTSAEALCKNAHLLLQKPVYCNDEIKTRSIIEILGWMAHAYDNIDAFTSPAGWVYNGLLRKLKVKGKPRPDLRPDPQYEKDPFAFLPFRYLEAVGLAEYYVQRRCESCKEPGGNHLPWCKNGAGKYTEVEEIIRESVDDAELAADQAPTVLDDPVIVQHWQKVLSRLRIELPRAQFDTWLRDTVPMDWEHQAGILNIGAGSNYARGWLETRVADTIVKMLADEMGRQVTVRFVVLGGGQ